jgi:hypothetical protein
MTTPGAWSGESTCCSASWIAGSNGVADAGHRLDAELGERAAELVGDHLDALEQLLVAAGQLERAVEVVGGREEAAQQVLAGPKQVASSISRRVRFL